MTQERHNQNQLNHPRCFLQLRSAAVQLHLVALRTRVRTLRATACSQRLVAVGAAGVAAVTLVVGEVQAIGVVAVDAVAPPGLVVVPADEMDRVGEIIAVGAVAPGGALVGSSQVDSSAWLYP
jgi:hypothetical protein